MIKKANQSLEKMRASQSFKKGKPMTGTIFSSQSSAQNFYQGPGSSFTMPTSPRNQDLQTFLSSIVKPHNKNRQYKSLRYKSQVGRSMQASQEVPEIKPVVLETRLSQNENFMNVSNGFKRIFSNDKLDKKMVLPIAGYGGHRRGDRSQNFFGKSFRESSL